MVTMIALFLSFCMATGPTCHEELAGRFATFEECQDAATKRQMVQFKAATYDEQGAVLTAMSCRPLK
jgi:hypothetical protein